MLSKRRTPPIRASSRPFRLGVGGQKSGRGGCPPPVINPPPKPPPPPPGAGGGGGRAQAALCARNPRSRQVRRRIAPPVLRQRPAAMGEACRATPRLAAAGCTKACLPRRWRFVACTSRRMVHRHAARPCLWSFHATPQARCRLRRQGRSRPCPWWLALPASGRKPVKPSRGDAESAMSPFGGGRPVRPCLVVNPGGGAAAPWA